MRLIALILILGAVPSFADTSLDPGDILISHHVSLSIGFTYAKMSVFTSAGDFKFEAFEGGRDVLVAPDGRIFAIDYWTFKVIAYSPSLHQTSVIDPDHPAYSLAMDREENLYAISSNGLVRRFTKAGVLARSQQLPAADGPIMSADLDIDQCTLYYFRDSVTRRHLRRFDLCKASELEDVPLNLPSCVCDSYSVRVAADGAVWVAGVSRVFRVVKNGAVEAYTPPAGGFSAAVAPQSDGSGVWLLGHTLVYLDLRTHSFVLVPNVPLSAALQPALAIYGIPRASVATPQTIPLVSTTSLIFLAISLAVAAFLIIPD